MELIHQDPSLLLLENFFFRVVNPRNIDYILRIMATNPHLYQQLKEKNFYWKKYVEDYYLDVILPENTNYFDYVNSHRYQYYQSFITQESKTLDFESVEDPTYFPDIKKKIRLYFGFQDNKVRKVGVVWRNDNKLAYLREDNTMEIINGIDDVVAMNLEYSLQKIYILTSNNDIYCIDKNNVRLYYSFNPDVILKNLYPLLITNDGDNYFLLVFLLDSEGYLHLFFKLNNRKVDSGTITDEEWLQVEEMNMVGEKGVDIRKGYIFDVPSTFSTQEGDEVGFISHLDFISHAEEGGYLSFLKIWNSNNDFFTLNISFLLNLPYEVQDDPRSYAMLLFDPTHQYIQSRFQHSIYPTLIDGGLQLSASSFLKKDGNFYYHPNYMSDFDIGGFSSMDFYLTPEKLEDWRRFRIVSKEIPVYLQVENFISDVRQFTFKFRKPPVVLYSDYLDFFSKRGAKYEIPREGGLYFQGDDGNFFQTFAPTSL